MDYATFEGRKVPAFTKDDDLWLSAAPKSLSALIETGCLSQLSADCDDIACCQCLLATHSDLNCDAEQYSKLVEIRRRYFAERLGATTSDKEVYVCNRSFGAAEPCPEGPCEIKLKAGITPNSGLCPVASGKGQPLWHQPGDSIVTAQSEEEVESAGSTISESVVNAAQWLIDQEHTFTFSEDESKFEAERGEHIDRIRDKLTHTQLAALVLSLALYSSEFKDCLRHVQEMER